MKSIIGDNTKKKTNEPTNQQTKKTIQKFCLSSFKILISANLIHDELYT